MRPSFFETEGDLRKWFEDNHDRLDVQWIGFRKKGTGLPSITWPESVDAALCFGWIDGVRKRIDDASYMIRFTPRRPKSRWSSRNLARMQALLAAGLVSEAGRATFESRDKRENQAATRGASDGGLRPEDEVRIKAHGAAWQYFQSSPPSYRKQVALWIADAKREQTRLKRLETLIECCTKREPIPPLRWNRSRSRPEE